MKKKFKLMDLDCANCAAKMESRINQLDEVSDATITFPFTSMPCKTFPCTGIES